MDCYVTTFLGGQPRLAWDAQPGAPLMLMDDGRGPMIRLYLSADHEVAHVQTLIGDLETIRDRMVAAKLGGPVPDALVEDVAKAGELP